MIAALFRRWADARAFRHADPLPDEVLRLLHEVPTKRRDVRHHRRRMLRHWLEGQPW